VQLSKKQNVTVNDSQVRRTLTWITPCKCNAARGHTASPKRNCVAVQHVHDKDKRFRLNYYVVPIGGEQLDPVLHSVCTGLSMLKSYGLEILERIMSSPFTLVLL
jgi:hypothetical protein